MYTICTIKDIIRVPPKEFGKKIKDSVLKIAQEEYEGIVDESIGVIIAAFEVLKVGDGKIIPGDGAAYYETEFKALTYKPEIQEVVEGAVTEITEFGAFVRTGPIEGLVHVSQIMDDYINYDAKAPAFVGKESGKKLEMDDTVFARVATASLKGTIPNSKIGLTMRQIGLGKREWLAVDLKRKEKGTKEKERIEKKKPERQRQERGGRRDR